MDEDLIQYVMEWYGLQGCPNAAKYIIIHGPGAAMSKWNLKAPYKTTEEVYAECIKREITWEELLDFKGYDENILL